MELYKKRISSELEKSREKSTGQKVDDTKVYEDRVKAAIKRIYDDMDASLQQTIESQISGQLKNSSTYQLLARNKTADRLLDKDDVEDVNDQVFTER